MSVVRTRKEATKRLALKLQADYRALVEASGEAEVQAAAIVLGDTFNSNIEWIINVLRDYGGLKATFEPLTRISPSIPPTPANDTPSIFLRKMDDDGRDIESGIGNPDRRQRL